MNMNISPLSQKPTQDNDKSLQKKQKKTTKPSIFLEQPPNDRT